MPRDAEKEGQLSEYEQRRIDNIKRNNARLRTLGLISSVEERRSNAIACGLNLEAIVPKDTSDDSGDDSDGASSEDGEWCSESGRIAQRKRRRKRKSPPGERKEGERKSRRLRGETAEYSPIDTEESLFSKDPAVREKEREDRVQECREVRLRAANAIAACGGAEAAKKNPTATYEHCLMRVKTMTEKGLVNRVKAIERAAGKHCVVKMAIFKSCLQDEGRWELAEVASDALERLKALKPIPEE